MAKKRESRLQRRMRDRLEKAFPGSWWKKIHGGPFQAAGIGDLMGCVYGLFVNIEVKRPDSKRGASEIQQENIEDIRKAGGIAFVCDDINEAVNRLLEELEAATETGSRVRMRKKVVGARVSATLRKDVDNVRRPRKKKA